MSELEAGVFIASFTYREPVSIRLPSIIRKVTQHKAKGILYLALCLGFVGFLLWAEGTKPH